MKASLSAGHFAVALLALSPTVSALAWPRWLPELDSLVVRQDDSSSSSQEESPSPTPTPTQSSSKNDDDSSSKSSATEEEILTTNLNTGGVKQTGTATGTGRMSGNATTTRAPKKTEFDPMDPAAGVVMVTPAITAGSQLYKLGDYITWGWNYTNLQGTPTAIDLYVKCSKVPQPWTLTQNMSYAEVGSYTWDTNQFTKEEAQVATPLLTEQYTLIIADADGGISATPEPGYLAPYSGFMFGLYQKQDYQNSGDGWQCASCSGAMSGLDNRAVGVAVVMSAATVLSFTWFVAGFGALL